MGGETTYSGPLSPGELQIIRAEQERRAEIARRGDELERARRPTPAAPRGPRAGVLRTSEMCEPASYAVEGDLAQLLQDCPRCSRAEPSEKDKRGRRVRCKRCHGRRFGLRDFAKRHRSELNQWRRRHGISQTLGALLSLGLFFHGLPGVRRKGDPKRILGRGLQLPLRFLSLWLGRDKSTVCDALEEGEARGLLKRYAPTRKVEHVTRGRLQAATVKGGEDRDTVNVHGVLYVTPAAVELLTAQGFTRAGGVEKRTGLVGSLLTALAPVLRAVARRCASAETFPTPKGRDEKQEPEYSSSTSQLVKKGRALGTWAPGSDPPDGPSGPAAPAGDLSTRILAALGRVSPPGRGWPRSLDALTRAELTALFAVYSSPDALWPDLWKTGDAHRRRWLASECERARARAYGRAWSTTHRQRGAARPARAAHTGRTTPSH